MKNILWFLVVIVAILVGYFVLTSGNSITTSGEITEVSLDQIAFDGPAIIKIQDKRNKEQTIAVPSMGMNLCAAQENIADVSIVSVGDKVEVSGNLDEEGLIIPCEDASHYLKVVGSMQDGVYGFSFDYRKGPNGYISIEDTESVDEDYVTGLTLFNKKEYEAFKESVDAREGPTSINFRVYQNNENLHAPVWALRKPLESNIELALSEPREVVVGGANAAFYTVDGLYPIDTYVVANGEHIYVLMGSYLDKEDQIYSDFKELVSSFVFVQTQNEIPQGKINVQVACESALAYMTFTSGAEADAFVESCVQGEHPEVIDRYIKDMGIEGALI